MRTEEEWAEPVVILSDAHFGHALSLARRPEQLRPVLESARTLILNGDTFEQRLPCQRERAARLAEGLEREAAAAGCGLALVAGNHDPFISTLGAVSLCGGRVFVTHGHALFDAVTPWSNRAAAMRRRMRELEEMEGREGDPLAGLSGLERRLAAARMLSIETDTDDLPEATPLWRRVLWYLGEFLHPERPLAVLAGWAATPRRAAVFAELYAPAARFLVIGHTHFRGVWHRAGRVVINTGSFGLPLGRSAVRIADGELRVIEIAWRRGRFEPGRILRRFALKAGGAAGEGG